MSEVKAWGRIDGREVEVEIPPDVADAFPTLEGISIAPEPVEPPELCPERRQGFMPISAEAMEDAASVTAALNEFMRAFRE